LSRSISLCFAFSFCFNYTAVAQSDFQEITRLKTKLSSLGGGQQLTDKWPIATLRERIRTITINVQIMATMDVDQFIEDMNSNPRITMLRITTRSSKNYTASDLQTIPLHKLKYVKHLSFVGTSYKNLRISEMIDWNEIVKMGTLEYLYLQPYTGYGFGANELTIPKPIAEKLAKNLVGYANYAYGGELDGVENNLQELYLVVISKQQNQALGILQNSTSLKYLGLNVDTISAISLETILNNPELVSLRLENPAIDYIDYFSRQNKGVKLPLLKELQCGSHNISAFQSIASQLTSLNIDKVDENSASIETFLAASTNLESLNIANRQDSILTFKINPELPLKKLKISGKLIALPDEICSFNQLEELILRYNKLRTLPSCFSNLTSLRIVELSDNHLGEEPPFWSWPMLETLKLNHNYVSSISDDWCNNTALKFLNLSNNPFDESLESLHCCKNLIRLNLSNTCITALPQKIGQLKKLEILKVGRYNSSSLYDRETIECESELNRIPESISELPQLNILSFSGQKKLSSKDVEAVLNTISDSIEISFQKCDLTSLPKSNWQNPGIHSLDLSSNEISNLPPEMFNTSIPNLKLRGNELGILNQNITTKTEKLIWQFSAGLEVSEELIRQPDVVDAVINIGNKYYGKPEHNPILDLIPLVLPLDTLEILSKIRADNYGKALFQAERYDEAEKFLSMAIKKHKEGCAIFVNAIADLYLNRHKCYLELKDTLSAINDLNYIQEEYGFFTGFEVFALELERENMEEVSDWKPLLVEEYKSRQAKNSKKQDLLNELSILEIYLVTNDTIAFTSYSDTLSTIDFAQYKPIYEYLNLLIKLGQKEIQEVEIKSFGSSLENFKNTKWSCRLVSYWSKQFSSPEKEKIEALNLLICPLSDDQQ